MTETSAVAVIGLGVIGGSLARDLAALGIRVTAYDTHAPTLRAAIDSDVVAAPLGATLAGIEDVDIVILATPLGAAIEILNGAAERLRQVPLITDVCSTKQSIAAAARGNGLGDRFVGGHPLAGDHRSGWRVSRRGLFVGATTYICADGLSCAEGIARVEDLWSRVGARTEAIDALEHDRLLAFTSHLPQALSTALVRTLVATGIDLEHLGPGGRDMTRLAGGDPELWASIAHDNAGFLGTAVEALRVELDALRSALDRSDREALRDFFRPAAPEGPSPDVLLNAARTLE